MKASPRRLARAAVRFLGAGVLRWLLVGVLAALVLGLVELAIAFFLQLFLRSIGVIDPRVGAPAWMPDAVDAFGVAALLVTIAVIRAAAQFLSNQANVQTFEGLNARLRRLALFRMTSGEGGAFVPSAEVNAQLADTFPKAAYGANFGAALLGAAVQTLVLAVLLCFTSLGEAVAGLAGLGLVGVIVLRINRTIRTVAAAIPKEQTTINEGIQRVARNFVLVRVLRTYGAERARLVRAVDAFSRHSTRAGTLSSLAYAITPLLGTLLLTAIVVLSQQVLHTPGMQLVAFLYLFVRFVQAVASCVQQVSMVNQFLPQLRASWRFANAFGDDGVVAALRPPEDPQAGPPEGARGIPPAIDVDDVVFRYPGAEHDVLEGLSVHVAPGEQLGIIGPSGCGKSTLLLLVLGLLKPARGSVTMGGREPSELLASGEVRVGYVGAEPFLVAGSIRENLLYGNRRQPDDAAVRVALAQARLDDVVDRLPGGLEFRLSENGEGLSAGQQQRLCLARALLNDPQLLILDEVSANLDVTTEHEIAESVRTFGSRCTTIIVSHRPGMLRHAARVLELGPTRQAA